MEKSFSGHSREEAHQRANEWWAAQTGLREIRRREFATGDDGPSLLDVNNWTVSIDYERSRPNDG